MNEFLIAAIQVMASAHMAGFYMLPGKLYNDSLNFKITDWLSRK